MNNLINKDDRIFIAGHRGMVGSSIYSLIGFNILEVILDLFFLVRRASTCLFKLIF